MNNDTHITQLLADPDRRDEAFRLLMQRYGRSLYWHIRRIVVDHDDAEDALQDTAISVLAGLDNYRGDSELGTWLYRIATNQALLLLKRRKRWYQRLDDLGPALAERRLPTTSTQAKPSGCFSRPCSSCPPSSASLSTCVIMTNCPTSK